MNAEQIAKALRSCARNCDGSHSCWHSAILKDAAALIESLQADNAELRKANSEYQDAQHPLFMALCDAQRRADAAVADLKHMDNCDICKHGQTAPDGCDCECDECTLPCVCRDCRNEDKWEWRGPSDGED